MMTDSEIAFKIKELTDKELEKVIFQVKEINNNTKEAIIDMQRQDRDWKVRHEEEHRIDAEKKIKSDNKILIAITKFNLYFDQIKEKEEEKEKRENEQKNDDNIKANFNWGRFTWQAGMILTMLMFLYTMFKDLKL